MQKKKSPVLLILIAILVVLFASTAIFYFAFFPKMVSNHLLSERDDAPDYVVEAQKAIRQNAPLISTVLQQLEIDKKDLQTVINSINYSNIANMSDKLHEEGFNDRAKCLDIILSEIPSDAVDQDKLRRMLLLTVTTDDMKEAFTEIDKLKGISLRASMPALKQIINDMLEQFVD